MGMDVGRGAKIPPHGFSKFQQQNVVFLVSSGKNQISPLFYTTTKMTHVTATVPKMRFVGSKVSFHIVQTT